MPSNNSKYIEKMREQIVQYILGSRKLATNVAKELGIGKNTVSQWARNYQRAHKGSESPPEHRYGAIKLSPSYDEELQSLFHLIFEYLEAKKKDDHRNLHYC